MSEKARYSCPKCGSYLLDHPEERMRIEEWLKCPSCGYCRKRWWSAEEEKGKAKSRLKVAK